ncbi:hypothetical protein U27_02990 [Candidatus Vecturithrix granuli]|uniref:Uncharacterized protein n=1 Tax=Vecturithrix granuli TaxID=1499967 RepID=A0A081BUM3_VECG1|nr:hypothetical protein U27_02990 [Candidatus Vecturithrix granuli]
MISEPLLSEIERFLQEADGRYKYRLAENVSSGQIEHVMNKYVPRIIEASQREKEMILNNLKRSLSENQDHKKLSDWKGAAMGTVQYLLLPTLIEEVNRIYATDVIVRLSRWYYTDSNVWKRFRPYAEYIVRTVWGGQIENLYYGNIHKH